MKESFVNYISKPKLRNPILLEGLPGIGNVGRVAAGYIVNQLKAKKFAELYSPQFLPLVALQKNGVARLLKAEFFYIKGKKNDIVILIGDSQSTTMQGYYDLCGAIIELAKKMGIKQIITLGGVGVEKMSQEPKILGAVNDEKLLKEFSDYGILFDGSKVGTIVGASGLLLGMAKINEIDAMCLMAETPGFPLVITDPIGADVMLKMLIKLLGLKIDLTKLENEVRELEDRIKKTEELHKKMIGKVISDEKHGDETRYIG